jgi:hypothetical protein
VVVVEKEISMKRHRLWSAAFVAGAIGVGVLSITAPAAGHAVTAAVGVVTDDSGGALPGVTVTATSPALQVPSVVSVTSAEGDYRLSPLATVQETVTMSVQAPLVDVTNPSTSIDMSAESLEILPIIATV